MLTPSQLVGNLLLFGAPFVCVENHLFLDEVVIPRRVQVEHSTAHAAKPKLEEDGRVVLVVGDEHDLRHEVAPYQRHLVVGVLRLELVDAVDGDGRTRPQDDEVQDVVLAHRDAAVLLHRVSADTHRDDIPAAEVVWSDGVGRHHPAQDDENDSQTKQLHGVLLSKTSGEGSDRSQI